MKKIKHLGILLSSLALVLVSCGNDSYKDIRFSRNRRGEIIDAITSSDAIDALLSAKIDIKLRHRYRMVLEDSSISEGDVNGTFLGELDAIILNKETSPISKVEINGDITLGDKSLNDFSNTFYYLNDDRVYHSFSSSTSAIQNVFYSLPSFDGNGYVDPIKSTIKEDLLDCAYEAKENRKLYQITFDLENKVYSYLYEYASMYYAKENNIEPSQITPEQLKLIMAFVDSSIDTSKLDITFSLNKKDLVLQTYSLDLGVTLIDLSNTNASNNTYNRYILNGSIEGNIKYNQSLDFVAPSTSAYKESDEAKEILDLLSNLL